MKVYITMKDYKKSDFQSIEAIFEDEKEAIEYAKNLQNETNTDIIEYYVLKYPVIPKPCNTKKGD